MDSMAHMAVVAMVFFDVVFGIESFGQAKELNSEKDKNTSDTKLQ